MRVAAEVTPAEVQSFYRQKDWADGLPVVPATADLVEQWLARLGWTDRRDEVVCKLPPANRSATVETVIVNSIMAGCEPDDVPYVVAALQAVVEPHFNLASIQGTTHPAGVLVVIEELSEPARYTRGPSAWSPGSGGPVVVGRALRLCLQNVGGARAGVEDRSTQGSPIKHAFAIAVSPRDWPGEPAGAGTGDGALVHVYGAEAPRNCHDLTSTTGFGVLTTIAQTIATIGSNNPYFPLGSIPVFLAPEHAQLVVASGMSREDAAAFLFEIARVPAATISEGGSYAIRQWPPWFHELHRTGRPTPIVRAPGNFHIYVAGGPGNHSSVVPGFGLSETATRVVDLPDSRIPA